MVHHCATPRNLHVLVVIEQTITVHTGAYTTHADMIQAWRDWVCSVATQETALDEELRDLAGFDGDDPADIQEVVAELGSIDLAGWWIRRADGLNEVRFYEVQDRRNTP